MAKVLTVGLPVMRKERGERRAFLPSFVRRLGELGVQGVLEEGYGQGLGFTPLDYCQPGVKARFASREEVYGQDLVVVLRAPEAEDLRRMKAGASLLSMLHYDTRPRLAREIAERGIKSYSLDSIADDNDNRIVVTYELTAGAGVREAFRQMALRRPDFYSPSRGPVRVTILGMGHLGVQAGRASFAMGEECIKAKVQASGARGVIVTYLEREITGDRDVANRVLQSTDLLIDATKRQDPTQYVIANSQVGAMPGESIILDLTADPYDTSVDPIQVKAVEGIPTGDLDKYVFDVDDPIYRRIPSGVETLHRRVVVSCNAWPGVTPLECMKVYEDQLIPLIALICRRGRMRRDSSNPLERALYRSTIEHFLGSRRWDDLTEPLGGARTKDSARGDLIEM
ncbi:MAG: alanine dehydrogenase [Bacillota bacterium]